MQVLEVERETGLCGAVAKAISIEAGRYWVRFLVPVPTKSEFIDVLWAFFFFSTRFTFLNFEPCLIVYIYMYVFLFYLFFFFFFFFFFCCY